MTIDLSPTALQNIIELQAERNKRLDDTLTFAMSTVEVYRKKLTEARERVAELEALIPFDTELAQINVESLGNDVQQLSREGDHLRERIASLERQLAEQEKRHDQEHDDTQLAFKAIVARKEHYKREYEAAQRTINDLVTGAWKTSGKCIPTPHTIRNGICTTCGLMPELCSCQETPSKPQARNIVDHSCTTCGLIEELCSCPKEPQHA